jgi:hypothetical protein
VEEGKIKEGKKKISLEERRKRKRQKEKKGAR